MDHQIDKEREGEQIDRALLKNVIDIFVEIGLGGAPNATPGQAGLPAEFKHINKRRKRNLQGFP